MKSTYQQSMSKYTNLFAQKREFKGNYFLTNKRTGETLNKDNKFQQGVETKKMALDIDLALDKITELSKKGYEVSLNKIYETI